MDSSIRDIITELEREGRFPQSKEYMQHGDVSVYDHSVQVARQSLRLVRRMNLTVDERSLIRGALLHDYFLYDWHERDAGHRLHGFFHPGKALANARSDYDLNETEENIILRHMFPLTPVPPRCREAWIVCLADKYIAAKETFRGIYKYR